MVNYNFPACTYQRLKLSKECSLGSKPTRPSDSFLELYSGWLREEQLEIKKLPYLNKVTVNSPPVYFILTISVACLATLTLQYSEILLKANVPGI